MSTEDHCDKCGEVKGYHCQGCHQTFTKIRQDEFLLDAEGKQIKTKKGIRAAEEAYEKFKEHNCPEGLLNPISEDG